MNKLNIMSWLLILLGIIILIFYGADLRFVFIAFIIAIIGALLLALHHRVKSKRLPKTMNNLPRNLVVLASD